MDGAPACPFVAFEDDRDARATAPDHRHRCFAEPRPAPRALAHQEAYCLSSAFPVCPTFQDWARREAAAARPAPNAGRNPDLEPPVSQPLPPLDRDEYRAPGTDAYGEEPPRRSQPRDWAAPPPWVAGAAAAAPAPRARGACAAAGASSTAAAGASAAGAASPDVTPPGSQGLAGSAADRLAGPDPSDPLSPAPSRPVADDLDEGADARPRRRARPRSQPRGRIARDDLDDEPDWGQPQESRRPRAAGTSPRPRASPSPTTGSRRPRGRGPRTR